MSSSHEIYANEVIEKLIEIEPNEIFLGPHEILVRNLIFKSIIGSHKDLI
jgi:hypothetical protein